MPGPRQRAEAAEPAQPPGPVPAETSTRPVSRRVFLLWSFSPSPLENGWEQSHGSWRALPTASPKRAGLVKACKKSGAPRAASGPPGSSTCVPVRREHFPPEVSGPVNGCARKPPAICHHDPWWNGSHRKCHAGIHRCCSESSSAGLCVLRLLACSEPSLRTLVHGCHDLSGRCRQGSNPSSATHCHPSIAYALSSQVEMEIGLCLGTKLNKAC